MMNGYIKISVIETINKKKNNNDINFPEEK